MSSLCYVIVSHSILCIDLLEALQYIDLARAKSEALNNIYSLFKQNIKSCNAKRRRQRRRTVKNNNRSI